MMASALSAMKRPMRVKPMIKRTTDVKRPVLFFMFHLVLETIPVNFT